MMTLAYPVRMEMHTFNMHVRPLKPLIQRGVMALKSHKAWDLDLRSVRLLDNQSTFDLCCNPDFARERLNAKQAINMLSKGGGL
jgi:hypothetical protein